MTTLARALAFAGLACLGVITLASPGATRMWATPWTRFLFATTFLPAVALLVRALDSRAPLVLPSRSWLTAIGAGTAVLLLSAALSPYASSSLRWSVPLLATPVWFLLTFDWLHRDPASHPDRSALFAKAGLLAALLVGGVSIGLWLPTVARVGLRAAAASRNAFPLGHSNYTAGLALLLLPLAVSGIWRHRGIWRALAVFAAALALAMLFSSSSRGGVLGLAVLAAAGLSLAPFPRKTKALLTLAAGVAGLVFVLGNPRLRATLSSDGPDQSLVAGSDDQRLAMLVVGRQMGADRPLLGWGPGTTPLVYPSYRAAAPGGVENVLQLHSAPLQLWAEFGLAGLGCLVGALALAFRARHRAPLAAATLAGYAAFALTDWQLDLPAFAFALALLAALLAPVCHPLDDKPAPLLRPGLAAAIVVSVAAVAILSRRDPAPELNVRALALPREPAHAVAAIALLRESLALNPTQEIAHFNLGWLLLTREPVAAEQHFRAAARLVPDKGGVYFGVGLARLNQGRPAAAVRAFALECLNDPRFLTSPWWREPSLAPHRAALPAALAALRVQADATAAPALARAQLLAEWLDGRVSTADLARHLALPTNQIAALRDAPARLAASAVRTYRRERSGYPVLMRNLDLPVPQDLFDVQDNALAVTELAFLFPRKGWAGSAALTLLDAPLSPTP